MNTLERYFNQALQFKRGNYGNENLREFIYITCWAIREKYMFLIPSESNIQFIDSLKKVFPNMEVIEEYDLENRDKTISLVSTFRNEIKSKNPEYENFLNTLKKSCIIAEIDPKLNDYFDSLKIAGKILNERYTKPKQILFSDRRSTPMLSLESLMRLINRNVDFDNYEIHWSKYLRDQISITVNFILNLTKQQILDVNPIYVNKYQQQLYVETNNKIKNHPFFSQLELSQSQRFHLTVRNDTKMSRHVVDMWSRADERTHIRWSNKQIYGDTLFLEKKFLNVKHSILVDYISNLLSLNEKFGGTYARDNELSNR